MDALSQYIDTSQLKSMIATVKNAVLNYSEIQAKTDEATNGDHWGASSTLMNELANATNNPIHLNEIFDIILKKLLESGSNWRQCCISI